MTASPTPPPPPVGLGRDLAHLTLKWSCTLCAAGFPAQTFFFLLKSFSPATVGLPLGQQRPRVGQRLSHPLGQISAVTPCMRVPLRVCLCVCAGGCCRSGLYSFAHTQPGTRAWLSPSVSPEGSLGRAVVPQPSWVSAFVFLFYFIGHASGTQHTGS